MRYAFRVGEKFLEALNEKVGLGLKGWRRVGLGLGQERVSLEFWISSLLINLPNQREL